jgi:hypothetical protein
MVTFIMVANVLAMWRGFFSHDIIGGVMIITDLNR